MNRVTAFQCEYCHRKVMMNKTHLADHEKICFHNPARKACQTCGNLGTTFESDYSGHQFGEATYTEPYKVKYCKAQDEKNLNDIPIWEQCNCKLWITNQPPLWA